MAKKEAPPTSVSTLRDLVNQRMKRQVLALGSEVLASDISGHIPTGWTLLDANLGGGIPLGRTIEIFGEESVGKSSLVWQAISNCQRMGGTAVLFEPEVSFPKDLAGKMGVNVDKLLILNPGTFMEEVFSLFLNLSELIRENVKLVDSPILLVWDTLASTPSRAEHEAFRAGEDMSRTANPYRAQVIKSGLRALSVTLAKTKTSLVIVNHVFADIQQRGGQRGPNTATPGGRGVKYQASARINLWAGAYIRPKGAPDGAEPEGVMVTAKVEKNKLGVPKRKVKSPFYYGRGYDDEMAVFNYLSEVGIIRQASSWYYVPNPGGEEIRTYATGYKEKLAGAPGLSDHLRALAVANYNQQVVVGKEVEDVDDQG